MSEIERLMDMVGRKYRSGIAMGINVAGLWSVTMPSPCMPVSIPGHVPFDSVVKWLRKEARPEFVTVRVDIPFDEAEYFANIGDVLEPVATKNFQDACRRAVAPYRIQE